MKKSQHKILALLLAVMLVAGILPVTAFASELSDDTFTRQGRVVDAESMEGLAGAVISIWHDVDDPNSLEAPQRNPSQQMTTGSGGSYSFSGIPSGYYFIRVRMDGYNGMSAVGPVDLGHFPEYELIHNIELYKKDDGGGEQPSDPVIEITTQPAANTPVTVGEINKTLSIVATPPDNESLSYEWYQNTTGNASGGDVVGTDATLNIPTDLAIGTYYFYCVVSADGLDDAISSVAKVTVSAKDTTPPSEPEPEPDDNDNDDDRRPFIPSSDNDDDDNDDDYGRRTTSGGGGGGGGSSAPTVNTPVTVSSSDATASVTNALANATNGSATAKLTNPGDVSLGTLQSMANQAGNTELKVNADSLNGNAVDVRITLDPSAATSALNLSASTVNPAAESRKAQFEKFFSNDLMAVSLGQQGSFGMPVTIAAKLDPTLDTDNLVFYSYNSTTNTYTAIAAPAYWVDANGYVHFTTTLGGSIVISDGALARK